MDSTGDPSSAGEQIERANDGLSALGRPHLDFERDTTAATPEELAPRVPEQMRGPMLELLYELAGEDPIPRRIADAYAALRRTRAVVAWPRAIRASVIAVHGQCDATLRPVANREPGTESRERSAAA